MKEKRRKGLCYNSLTYFKSAKKGLALVLSLEGKDVYWLPTA